jgi:hypothetical protein
MTYSAPRGMRASFEYYRAFQLRIMSYPALMEYTISYLTARYYRSIYWLQGIITGHVPAMILFTFMIEFYEFLRIEMPNKERDTY